MAPEMGDRSPVGETAGHVWEVFRINGETAKLGGGSGILGGLGSGVLVAIFGPGVDADLATTVALACAPLAAAAWSVTSDLVEGTADGWTIVAGGVMAFVLATVVCAAIGWVLGYPFVSVPDVIDVNAGLPALLAVGIGALVGLRSGWSGRSARAGA